MVDDSPPAAEEAKPKRIATFSHSRLTSYEKCPLKYRFDYLDGLARGPDSIEAFTGKLVHEVLEWVYTQIREAYVPEVGEALDVFTRIWQEQWSPDIRIVKENDTPEQYRAMGARCLKGYFRRYEPFDQDVTVGIEMRLEFPLDPPHEQHWIQGFADRISRTAEGVYEIRDYKTGRWVPRQPELDKDRQLAFYEIALRGREEFRDAREVQLVWNYLQKNMECRSTRTAAELQQLRKDTLVQVMDIVEKGRQLAEAPERADELFPAKTSRLCDWCDFKPYCPSHGGDPANAPRKKKSASQSGGAPGQLSLF
jgi:putative RecB family exonuclease